MERSISIGIPLRGTTVWPTGATFIKSLATAAANLPKQERPKLFLVVTDTTLPEYPLYEPFIYLFQGVIYCGHELAKARAILGPKVLHCSSHNELFKYIHRYFPTDPSRNPLAHFLPCPDLPKEDQVIKESSEAPQKFVPPNRYIFCSNTFWIQEGHIHLFKALALLKQRGQDIHLVYEGSISQPRVPQYQKYFRQYLRKLNIQSLVHMVDSLIESDRVELIRHSLFVVQPGVFDGLSLLIQQCQALGKVVITSEHHSNYLDDYLICLDSCAPDHLAEQILQLLVDVEPKLDIESSIAARAKFLIHTKQLARNFFYPSRELHKRKGQELCNQAPDLAAIGKNAVNIATSIAPRDLDNQKQAIASWLNMGFRVVSFNASEEIAIVQPYFPEIEFVTVAQNAKMKYGKPYVYVDNILDYFNQQDAGIYGIVNSDIHFRNEFLYDFITKEAVNSLVYGSRVDIKSMDDPAGIMDIWGYDYFFFDSRLIPYFPREEFCLGIPWWDLWIPLIVLGYKLPVKKLMTPHAYHIVHPTRYDQKTLFSLSYAVAKYIAPPFDLTEQSLHRYGMFLRLLINRGSKEITFSAANQVKDRCHQQS